MMIDPRPAGTENSLAIAGSLVTCSDCRTATYVTVESIQSVVPRLDGWVMVEYSCRKCGSCYALKASVQAVACFLTLSDTQRGVMKSSRYYIHCGEPMVRTGLHLTGVGDDDVGLSDAHYVRLSTDVLRCHCGFQMLLPG